MTSTVLDQTMPLDAYKAFMPAFEEEFDELAELGTRPATHEIAEAAQLTPRVKCCRHPATRTATWWCWWPTPTSASPATSASSA